MTRAPAAMTTVSASPRDPRLRKRTHSRRGYATLPAGFVTALFANLLATALPVAAVPPATINGGAVVVYTEGTSAVNVGAGITITNGEYEGQYLEFDANGPLSTDELTMTEGSPDLANGVVSISGDVVYLGDGVVANRIGAIDPVFNGSAGQALRVNFTKPFTNGSFEEGGDGLLGWTPFNERVDLGVTTLAACPSQDYTNYPAPPFDDDSAPTIPGEFTTTAVDIGDGTHKLRLSSLDIGTATAFDAVHGPAIVSSPFDAAAGDVIRFDWRTMAGSDSSIVAGYLVDTSCNQIQVLEARATGTTSWAPRETIISGAGTYRLVLVSGSYDSTGGSNTAGTLELDNVRLVGTSSIPADIAQAVARKLMYRSTSSIAAPATRTIALHAQSFGEPLATGSIAIDFQPAPEAPTFTDSTLGPMHRNVVYSDGITTAGWPVATYGVSAGVLPSGLTLDTNTGSITGTPNTLGDFPFTITATNGVGSPIAQSFAGHVDGAPVTFTDSTIGAITVGTAFTDGVVADGLPAPTYTVLSGALPTGLALSASTGAITGTPTGLGGAYSFIVRATNTYGHFDLPLSGTMSAPPVFTDSTLGRVTTAAAVNDGVFATAEPAATYAVTSNLGHLPAGLTLDATTGAITGTATESGPYGFSITATNGVSPQATVALSGTVFTSPLSFTDATLGRIAVGTAFTDAVAADGREPPTYTVSAGLLPAGVALATDGAITGTPTGLGGAFSFTVTATNSEGSIFTTITGTVFAAPTAFTDATLGHIRTIDAYSDRVTANGVLAPTYAVTAGALPAGLTLSSGGAVTGNATTRGDFSVTITATNAEGSLPVTLTGRVVARDLGFLGLGPIRLLDTRQTDKPAVGSVTQVPLSGVAGVPVDATAIVLNITVEEPDSGGYLTVFPCGSPIPYASNANFRAGETVPSSVTAAIGDGSMVCVYASTSANLIVDLNGAFSPTMGGGKLLGLTPARLLDTRGQGGKLGRDQTRVVQVAGFDGVPIDATSVVLNVTADSPDAVGYVTVYPCGTARPDTSNLNFLPGQTVANAVTVALGATGAVCVHTTATTHLIVDVSGAYSPGSGEGELFSMEPARMFDSRGQAKVAAGTVVELDVAGSNGVPTNAIAVALSITIDSADSGGYVTVHPCGAAVPYASNLNFTPGRTVANSVLATVGANGRACFLVTGTAHLIVDVNAAYVF